MATTAKQGTAGVVITTDGQWRCNTCERVTGTTSICSGAHLDGSPRCGVAICEHCAPRCVHCKSPLCASCHAQSKEGMLCVQCPPPAGGRMAYMARQRARTAPGAGIPNGGFGTGADWQAESDRAYRAAAEAQQSVDDAARRVEEIDRQIAEMKARMRRGKNP